MQRAAGLLLHPSSLPGGHGIGDLGDEAYRWVDFLVAAQQTLWQVLPLGPTGYGDSPYASYSAFAGNPNLVSLERLVHDNLLRLEDVEDAPENTSRVNYGEVYAFKQEALGKAYLTFVGLEPDHHLVSEFEAFCQAEAAWLNDYALFVACKEAQDYTAWNRWPAGLRQRRARSLAAFSRVNAERLRQIKFVQWLFYRQWLALKSYANARNVQIVGDIPIFVAFDSADVWANANLFYLDAEGNPEVVAGVPPDYFSATGQRWGNPLYRWNRMKRRGFSWWIGRVQAALRFYDLVRLDHFRGFEAYWEIPAAEDTAVNGRWVKGPGQPFFDALTAALGELPIIAEDLGVITPAVEALRDDNQLPGMKVLQFAFAGQATDPYLPHNYRENFVVYTGTHDNPTTLEWYRNAPEKEQDMLRRYLGSSAEDVIWALIRAAYASVARWAVIPLQDVLGLAEEGRMNRPGELGGNWSWRMEQDALQPWMAPTLAEFVALYSRMGLDNDAENARSEGA